MGGVLSIHRNEKTIKTRRDCMYDEEVVKREGMGLLTETGSSENPRGIPEDKKMLSWIRWGKGLSLGFIGLYLIAMLVIVIWGLVESYAALVTSPVLISFATWVIPAIFMAGFIGARNMVWSVIFWALELLSIVVLTIMQLVYFGLTIYYLFTLGWWVVFVSPLYLVFFFVSIAFWIMLVVLLFIQSSWVVNIYWNYKVDDSDYQVSDIGKKIVFYVYTILSVMTHLFALIGIFVALLPPNHEAEPVYFYTLFNAIPILFTIYYAEIRSFVGFQRVHGIILLVILFIHFVGTIVYVIFGFLYDLPTAVDAWVAWMVLIANILTGIIGNLAMFIFVLVWCVIGFGDSAGTGGWYPYVRTENGWGQTEDQKRRFLTQNQLNSQYKRETPKVK